MLARLCAKVSPSVRPCTSWPQVAPGYPGNEYAAVNTPGFAPRAGVPQHSNAVAKPRPPRASWVTRVMPVRASTTFCQLPGSEILSPYTAKRLPWRKETMFAPFVPVGPIAPAGPRGPAGPCGPAGPAGPWAAAMTAWDAPHPVSDKVRSAAAPTKKRSSNESSFRV